MTPVCTLQGAVWAVPRSPAASPALRPMTWSQKRNAIEGVFGAEISVAVDEIRKAAALQGCGDEAVDKCLEEYEELGLWKVGEDNMLVWVADDGDA